jgi:general secretion pathway protein G
MPILPFKHSPTAAKRVRRNGQSGVTLIEMMIVLVIIGVVAALVVPNVIGRPDEARVAVANADLRTISASLEMYRLDNRAYPTAAQGLAALSQMPTDAPLPPNWVAGGYLPQVPTDPWGNPYVYSIQGSAGGYTLVSLGADGQPGGEGVDADVQHGNGLAANGAGG